MNKFVISCIYAIVAISSVCNIHALQNGMSNCKPNFEDFKLWNCRGTTATFDAERHKNVSIYFYHLSNYHDILIIYKFRVYKLYFAITVDIFDRRNIFKCF